MGNTLTITDSGIYAINNIINGKIYIGSASNLRGRWNGHLSHLRKNKHHNRHLQRAWNKYGENNFRVSVLELCEKDELIDREQYYINTLEACNHSVGYNINKDATSSIGVKRSEETKRRISESKKKNPTRYWKGKSLSCQHKKKIGAKSVGRGLNTHRGSIEFLKAVAGYSKVDRYRARIWHNNRRYNLGCFENREGASLALDRAVEARGRMSDLGFEKHLAKLSALNRNKKKKSDGK